MEQDFRQLKSLQNREPQAWLAVYHELGGDLFGYVYRLLRGDAGLAEETAQSTWLAAIEMFHQFEPNRERCATGCFQLLVSGSSCTTDRARIARGRSQATIFRTICIRLRDGP